jgi:hypothetical protein
VKKKDKCNTVCIYGKKIRISRPLARSSIIFDTEGTVDEEAMDEVTMDKEREEYENGPKRVNKSP